MTKNRLEAFSDGVIAIIITIMVLELKVPHGAELGALRPLAPKFLSYLLSYIYLGIYWNNHHHMLQATKEVDGRVLWANLHLLFWLSLIPFVTAWMGENNFSTQTVAAYGSVLLLAAIAYFILARCLVSLHGKNSAIGKAFGKDVKGQISIVLYLLALPIALYCGWMACIVYALVALMWLIPDKRIERILS